MKRRLQMTLRQIIRHFSSMEEQKVSNRESGVSTDGQSNLLTEKTGIAKTKIKWVHCLPILREGLRNRIRNRHKSQRNKEKKYQRRTALKQVLKNKISYFLQEPKITYILNKNVILYFFNFKSIKSFGSKSIAESH